MKEFNENDAKNLWKICQSFIKEHDIGCAETIYQCDSPQIAATEFIEKICDVVGYQPYDEPE